MKRILKIIGIILVACLGLSILGALLSPGSGTTPAAPSNLVGTPAQAAATVVSQPTALLTVAPTEPSKPTAAPEPTAEPTTAPTAAPEPTTAPEPTAEPTSPPEPTAIPTLAADAEETAYQEQMGGITLSAAKTMDAFSELAGRAGEDITLVLDTDWKTDLVVQLATMHFIADTIRDQTPPRKYARYHRQMLAVASNLDKAADAMAEGVDGMDVKKINQATVAFKAANKAVLLALAEWKKVQ